MPKKVEKCVNKVKRQPKKSKSDAWAICKAQHQKSKKQKGSNKK